MEIDWRRQRLFAALGDQAAVHLDEVAEKAGVTEAFAARELKRLGYVRRRPHGYLSPLAQVLEKRRRDWPTGTAA